MIHQNNPLINVNNKSPVAGPQQQLMMTSSGVPTTLMNQRINNNDRIQYNQANPF